MRVPLKKVVALVGLVVATSLVTVTLMGGGPVGAFSVPNNSVNSAKIVNNSIQGIDIKNGTITVADVNRASLGRPRVGVLVDAASTVGSLQTRYSVGVGSVTNPQAGVFCIQPSPAFNLAGVIPTIGLEYWGTAADDTVAWWLDPSVSLPSGFVACPSGALAVLASDSSSGDAVNDVAFTVRID